MLNFQTFNLYPLHVLGELSPLEVGIFAMPTLMLRLRFQKYEIRAIKSVNGGILWICLNDVCRALSRSEMGNNGQALKLCKTSARQPFCKEGRNRWGIKPHDIHSLLKEIRCENAMIAEVCNDFQSWINSLPIDLGEQSAFAPAIAIPSKEPVIFSYQDKFPITFKDENGKTMINATEMARSFGKLPAEWLKLKSTTEFRQRLVQKGESKSMESQIFASRERGNGTIWIDEKLAIELARWLSPEFSEWCNSCIQELMTKGVVSIKDAPVPSVNFPVPETLEEALLLAAHQQREIGANKYKVDYYNDQIENRDHFASSHIANELDISVPQLHQFLLAESIVKYENKKWRVHGSHNALQCEVTYVWSRPDGKCYAAGRRLRWTPAGRDYIIELWKFKN